MKAQKILFATDFSEHSEAARHFATSLARDLGASLLILHVVEPPPPPSADRGFGGYIVEGEVEAESQRRLNETVPGDLAVSHSHKLRHGPPAREILKCADEESVDMVVIGSHGRRGLVRMLLGSVAEGVVRKAKCPVITIKQPSKIAEEAAAG
jgi:nucleotide-binding universal stress UspA family protein